MTPWSYVDYITTGLGILAMGIGLTTFVVGLVMVLALLFT